VERFDTGEHEREKDRVKGDAQGKDCSVPAHVALIKKEPLVRLRSIPDFSGTIHWPRSYYRDPRAH
jgi:hypothetical protein